MLKKGDKVVMHTCGEAEHHNGRIWTVSSEKEWELCGSMVVMLEGFSGAFLAKYLQKVNLSFPKANDEDAAKGWGLSYEFMEEVEKCMEPDEYAPSLEGIELVLLALQKKLSQ